METGRGGAGGGAFELRAPDEEDLEWLVEAHAAIYGAEYGWGDWFRAIVAGVVADFREDFDPLRDRGWIAFQNGERMGSVLLVHHPERAGVARLRVLLVDPRARGAGIGGALVRSCSDFARAAGYHTITLWTNEVLTGARVLYRREGYRLVHQEAHPPFPAHQLAEVWELSLAPSPVT
jgi:GNAT superfamily N-acetyltransferase